jgi:hypothetical protein
MKNCADFPTFSLQKVQLPFEYLGGGEFVNLFFLQKVRVQVWTTHFFQLLQMIFLGTRTSRTKNSDFDTGLSVD